PVEAYFLAPWTNQFRLLTILPTQATARIRRKMANRNNKVFPRHPEAEVGRDVSIPVVGIHIRSLTFPRSRRVWLGLRRGEDPAPHLATSSAGTGSSWALLQLRALVCRSRKKSRRV